MYISEKMILDIFEKKKWSEKGSDYEENYWIIELLFTKKRICEKKMKKKEICDVYFIEKMILDILEKKKWKWKRSNYELLTKARIC